MLRVYLGWRFKAKITLTTRTRLLAAPPLGEGPFWLGMNGVLGAEGMAPGRYPADLYDRTGLLHRAGARKPQQGNRRVTYKFD
jgi:type VI secretion system protein ImpH